MGNIHLLRKALGVDHAPTLVGEDTEVAGYAALGRLFDIGYLKGLLEMC